MPPSRPLSQEELIEVLRRVADSQLTLSAAINRQATATEKLLPSFEQLRHDVADIKMDRELDSDKLALSLNKISTDLALLAKDVDDTQNDVKGLAKDVTGAFPLPRDERSTIEKIFAALEKSSVSTKLLVLILLIAAAASGWLKHLFE